MIFNIKIYDLNNIKIDEKSYRNIFIYCIRYVIIKDSKCKMNEYFQEINGNEYLTLVPNNKSKEEIKKNMKNCGVKSDI